MMAFVESRINRVFYICMVGTILTALYTPFLTNLFVEDKEWTESEKRVLAGFPEFPATLNMLQTFSGDFETYYNDHFGFREELIVRYNKLLEEWFFVSGNKLVLQGQDKWLFFTGDNSLDDFRGQCRLSVEAMQAWHKQQQERVKWLASRGVAYLSFSPPNKQSIYSEFLPANYGQVKKETKMEQLHTFLLQNPLEIYVNVHEILRSSKRQRQLYYRTDTHWNKYGAYIAFQELMGRITQLFPQGDYKLDFAFHRNPRLAPGGDLAAMLMLDRKMAERSPVPYYWESCSEGLAGDEFLIKAGVTGYKNVVYKKCAKASVKAIVFCDSFIGNLEPFLSENFSEVIYLRGNYSKKVVEQLLDSIQPDIVIEELVERNYL